MINESTPLTRAEARESVDATLQYLLEGGEYPVPVGSGISDATDEALGQVAGALLEGRDPAPEVAALWAAFDLLYP
ncbi:hypothetical protein SEA_FAYELY_3 [Mycobacterium phage Fayely]|uniref:hypothetical protein n=1 Tax=Mycobacterium phage Pioneer TaxID=1698417 RepID=UPI0006BDA258|nr:hypothetical protein AVV05_gp003 [Mycobacterium phage Pioneer]AVI04220.1 hypothetical protein SEA_PHONNEGUT_3 [Mycobacterium phage Phonnegut]AVI04436.1 hypothetical protein SEA_SCHERZO_3 [Mycobacterium phage Scherzo]AZF93484.1 hypothetical protein SEA_EXPLOSIONERVOSA_3 [Mycobacterium phage ExplosioNervosa]QBI96323.1 hypothetical protein SEA_UGENIE5_2 [Mycobacterium phage Ugenie5]QGJ88658.1 hypothetical protein SEA_BEEMO_3 [Mycobacterium phage Beemo]UVF60869.1 hypothetical protein SEA_FAYEL